MARAAKNKKGRLGNIYQRFEAARDNAALDCAQSNSAPADIKSCEVLSGGLIDAFFTTLQAGKIKASDIDTFKATALKGCLKATEARRGYTYLDLIVCRNSIHIATERIKGALKDTLGRKKRRR